MHWKIHPPRPSRFPSGLGVQNPRPWEISWASGGVFSDTSRLEAVYGHSFIIIREVLIFWCDNRWRCYLSSFVCKKTFVICNYTLFTNIKCLFFAQYTAVIIIWEWGNWYLSILHKGSTFMRGGPLHRLVSQRSARGRETNQPVWWIRALVG